MTPLRLRILCAAMQWPLISATRAADNGYVWTCRSTAIVALDEACELKLVYRTMRGSGLRVYRPWPDANNLRKLERELRSLSCDELEAYTQYAETFALFLADSHRPKRGRQVYEYWRLRSVTDWQRRSVVASRLIVAVSARDALRAYRSAA